MSVAPIGEVWHESLKTFDNYHHSLNKLLTEHRTELVRWLEKVLFQRHDMPLALVVVEKLSIDEKKQLFPSLVRLATKTVPHTVTVRNIVKGLPRDWVLQNVEGVINPILKQADIEELRRILELYSALDKSLLQRECERLIKSGHPDYEATAREFLG